MQKLSNLQAYGRSVLGCIEVVFVSTKEKYQFAATKAVRSELGPSPVTTAAKSVLFIFLFDSP